MSSRWRWCAALAATLAAVLPREATAQSCNTESYRNTANAAFAQLGEFGGREEWVADWTSALQNGYSVKYMMQVNLHDAGYFDRFVTGRTSEAILADLYRHILAREPDDGASTWIGVGETQGWHVVVDALLNSAEYTTRFNDFVVPGSPVVAWDCARAGVYADTTGIMQAHSSTFRDAGQGGSSVSYTTPAYVSLDQPRALTFSYSSGTAKPTGLVQFNVVNQNVYNPLQKASIRLQINGAWVTDEQVYQAGLGTTLLSAEFNAAANPSAAYLVTAVIRLYHTAGNVVERSVPVRVPVVNERNSAFGAGWTLAGLQRMTLQGDGVFITEGSAGLWFEKISCAASGLCRFASPSGDFTTVTYDGFNIDRRYPDGSLVRFNHAGQMTHAWDRFGNVTQYGYDTNSRLVSVTDPVGKVTTLGYTGAGALAWVQDPMGRQVTTASSGATLTGFRHPGETSLALDLQLATDTTGAQMLDTYWTEATPRSSGTSAGTHFDYDRFGRVAAVTAPQVAVTEDGVGNDVPLRPVTQTSSLQMAVLPAAGLGTPTSPAARVHPDAVRVTMTDPRGSITRVQLNPLGQPTRVEDPLNRVTTLTRDRHGRVVRTQAPSGHVGRAEYRGVELRLTEDLVTGAVVQMEYEPAFHQLTHMWGTGVTEVWNTYDTNDPQRKLKESRTGTLAAQPTQYTYETSRGRIESVVDPEGHGTYFDYLNEPVGNPTQNLYTVRQGPVDRSHITVAEYKYDSFGRDTAHVNSSNDRVRTQYDPRNRVTLSVDPAGGGTQYTYLAGHLYQITDPKQQTYFFHHDALGQVGSQVDPRGQYTYYRYDRVGNLTSSTNRRGGTIRMAYNALGQILSRVADGDSTTWSYDPGERWMVAKNAESLNRVEYDVAGRTTRTLTTLNGITYTHVFTANAQGQTTESNLTGPWSGARTIRYTYNARGQLDTLVAIGGGVNTFRYNGDGRESGRTLASGLTVQQDYPWDHVTAGKAYTSAAVDGRFGVGYLHDEKGQVSVRRMAYGGVASWAAESLRKFDYDNRGWLGIYRDSKYVPQESTGTPTDQCSSRRIPDQDSGPCNWAVAGETEVVNGPSYTYDAVGNRTDTTSLDTGNRLMSFRSYQFTYDADGNLTRKLLPGYDDLTATWNSLGQMTGAWRYQQGTVTYGYDAFGRRVRRTTPDSVIRYLYDGDDLAMELNAAGQPIREYTYLPGVDQPHSVRISATGQTYYYATDHPGNVLGLTDGANQVVNEYQYTPWGEPEKVLQGVTQPLRYMAREYDELTGLYQVRARWYDPQVGRFVSEDPIGLAGGLNPYAYAGNSPTNHNDPSGLCWWPRGAKHGAGGYGGNSSDTYFATDACMSDPSALVDDFAEWIRRRAGGLRNPLAGPLGDAAGGNGSHGSNLSCYESIPVAATCAAVYHFARNVYNKNAPSLQVALRSKEWVLQSASRSVWHRIGPGNENNLKFLSLDGHHESVFRPTGELVTDCVNQGTYNYGTSDFMHAIKDVAPYLLWGNCAN